MVVDHIGYAVKDIQNARTEFEFLGFSFGEVTKDFDRNLYIQFGINGHEKVELLQVMDKEKESPITEILKKNGAMPYHICYKVNNIQAEIEALTKRKWLIINPPSRAIALGGGG